MLDIVPSIKELSNPSSKIVEACSICNKRFKGNSALKTHLRRSHKEHQQHAQDSKYFCPMESCSHSLKNLSSPFTSFAAIKQHYKLVHGVDRFSCLRCNRVFKTKHSCKHHQIECGVRYLCSCDIEYTTKRGFMEHIKRQKHEIPEKLQSLFDMQAKQAKERFAAKPPVIRTSTNIILPNTLKKKVRLFQMSSNASAAFTKCLSAKTIATPLQSNLKDLVIRNIPQGATVVLPQCEVNGKKSLATQFPQPDDNDGELLSQLIADNGLVNNSTLTDSWPQKHISIQTEKSFAINQWIDGDVNKLLLENIGTQTMESVFGKTSSGTYSTLSQTDLGQNTDLSSLWEQSYSNFHLRQQVAVCDAQNQTVTQPLHIPTDNSMGNDFSQIASSDFGVTVHQPGTDDIANVYASIETQTDVNVNFLSAQTQTNPSLNFQPASSETELTFDVLNDIETQTDFLLPSLSDPSPSVFVHNCTQTSEPDLLSILEMDN